MIRDTTATFTTDLKTDDGLQALLQERREAFLVAEGPEGIAGFITWGPFRAGPGYARTAEHSIITGKPGQGTGRALMQAAVAKAADQGLHTFVAAISGENPAAIAFHSRLGFANAGRLREVGRKQGRWLDLILMTRSF